MRILITGGAGFVGSALALHFSQSDHKTAVVVLDNLRRRGSERNIDTLKKAGVAFIHGDVRNPADLDDLEGVFDVVIEASAEPSVHAGIGGSARYLIDTNLFGAANCLEFARRRGGGLVFLSTSRVYSIAPLLALPLVKGATRLDFEGTSGTPPGISINGVAEGFPSDTRRSYYGASKLAAELLCQEYAAEAGIPVVVNRCGVIAGPGQFGRTDQGVFTLWVARHHFGHPLRYTGFGGAGLQVRDLLHPEDLCTLIERQINTLSKVNGRIFNVGGGRAGSTSLQEFTALCQEITGRSVDIAAESETSSVDIPWYITDHGLVTAELGWSPSRNPRQIVADIENWISENERELTGLIV